MTVLIEGKTSYFFGTQATLLEDNRETASSWANDKIISNQAIKWVIGKYVEADNANYNGQLWSLADLQMKRPTIVHSPMNLNHAAHQIVGTFTAAEMLYPTDDQAQVTNPYIETLGAFWRFYFPEEMAAVDEAFKTGQLYQSMECVSETVTCAGADGCGMTFPYAGPRSESYCDCLQQGGVRQLNDPHFLAGALIIPPAKPGWGGASVDEIARILESNTDATNRIYQEVSNDMPHLDQTQWETLMFQLMQKADLSEPKTPAKMIGRRVARNILHSVS